MAGELFLKKKQINSIRLPGYRVINGVNELLQVEDSIRWMKRSTTLMCSLPTFLCSFYCIFYENGIRGYPAANKKKNLATIWILTRVKVCQLWLRSSLLQPE